MGSGGAGDGPRRGAGGGCLLLGICRGRAGGGSLCSVLVGLLGERRRRVLAEGGEEGREEEGALRRHDDASDSTRREVDV